MFKTKWQRYSHLVCNEIYERNHLESNFPYFRKFSALSLKIIIDHVSLFEAVEAVVHSSKTHRNLIIQMYNEITNSITICTTKVFNISEHWISIKLQKFRCKWESGRQIYCTYVTHVWGSGQCSVHSLAGAFFGQWNLELIEAFAKNQRHSI